MDKNNPLARTMLAMIRFWQQGDEKGCYREFFALNVSDRRVIQNAFKLAMKKHPTAAARKDAKGIYKLIEKNFGKEVSLMTDTLKNLLEHWFFSSKDVFFARYSALPDFEKTAMLESLQEVIADSKNAEFRQAAVDIPIYIRSREAVPSYDSPGSFS